MQEGNQGQTAVGHEVKKMLKVMRGLKPKHITYDGDSNVGNIEVALLQHHTAATQSWVSKVHTG